MKKAYSPFHPFFKGMTPHRTALSCGSLLNLHLRPIAFVVNFQIGGFGKLFHRH